MVERTRAYRRDMRNRKIARKKRIVREVWNDLEWWYKFDGQYSKGKIHCSCPMCQYWRKMSTIDKEKRKYGYLLDEIKEFHKNIGPS